MRTLKISLDCDMVVLYNNALKSAVAEERYGVRIAPQHFTRAWVAAGQRLTPKRLDLVYRTVYDTRRALEVEPVPGAIEGIAHLGAAGHELQIVTSRKVKSAAFAHRRLQQLKINLPLVAVGVGSKVEACRGWDVLVDDDHPKLTPLIGCVPHLFLFSYEYNASRSVMPPIRRAWGWPNLLDLIGQLAEMTDEQIETAWWNCHRNDHNPRP